MLARRKALALVHSNDEAIVTLLHDTIYFLIWMGIVLLVLYLLKIGLKDLIEIGILMLVVFSVGWTKS